MKLFTCLATLLVLPLVSGCPDDPTDEPTSFEGLELFGTWDDDYGGSITVTDSAWGTSSVLTYDNDGNWAVLQAPADDPFNPSAFSKVVWTEPQHGQWWTCTVVYGLDTEAEATDAAEHEADASDPGVGGCGGFPWTLYREPIEVKGTWHSSWGGSEAVTSFDWGTGALFRHNNDANWAVYRLPDNDPFNPGTYSKVVWTEPEAADGAFWACIVAFGLPTGEAAVLNETAYDHSDPASGGCGGFPWTRLAPILEVTGTWHSNWGGTETLDSDAWAWGAVREYDNAARWAVVQAADDDAWNPSTYSKLVWTPQEADGAFWYCTVVYGLETHNEARDAADSSDASDPAAGCCGGFPWTRLAPVIEVGGSFTTSFDTVEVIDSDTWNGTPVVAYDNKTNEAVLANPEDAEWNPGTYSKVLWIQPDWDGTFYYCTVAFALATEAQAMAAATDEADASDPDNGGCGGFPWTKLTPSL